MTISEMFSGLLQDPAADLELHLDEVRQQDRHRRHQVQDQIVTFPIL